jgi:hypothetical protein
VTNGWYANSAKYQREFERNFSASAGRCYPLSMLPTNLHLRLQRQRAKSIRYPMRDPAHCAILGNKMGDIEAGTAAGLGLRILLRSGSAKRKHAPSHDPVADLGEALSLLRSCI